MTPAHVGERRGRRASASSSARSRPPGCAIIMPVECARLPHALRRRHPAADPAGRERPRGRARCAASRSSTWRRTRSSTGSCMTGGGWILVSHEGLVRQVGVEGDRITVGDAWSMLQCDEDKDTPGSNDQEQWRPGGEQPFTLHRGTLAAVLADAQGQGRHAGRRRHRDLGVRHRPSQARGAPGAAGSRRTGILASQEPTPHLYVRDKDNKLHIYDGHRLKLAADDREAGRRRPACCRR